MVTAVARAAAPAAAVNARQPRPRVAGVSGGAGGPARSAGGGCGTNQSVVAPCALQGDGVVVAGVAGGPVARTTVASMGSPHGNRSLTMSRLLSMGAPMPDFG
ncbi:hypothetical protein BCD48_05925 [Pseudofrankia sp. BMG5.36]|nr:hypothetical protein BCD48_05925 [Pseudofrankia sp. BMG5.36]